MMWLYFLFVLFLIHKLQLEAKDSWRDFHLISLSLLLHCNE